MSNAGTATGGVRTLIRMEGLALCAGMTCLLGMGRLVVGLRHPVLAHDRSFAGYIGGPKTGAVIDKTHAHSYMAPDGADDDRLAAVSACWCCRSPLNLARPYRLRRALGYGRKPGGFGLHPYGQVGKKPRLDRFRAVCIASLRGALRRSNPSFLVWRDGCFAYALNDGC